MSSTSEGASIFRLYDVHIRTAADVPHVADMLRKTLRYKGAAPDASASTADLTLDFSTDRSPESIPDTARQLGQTEHGGIWIWQGEDRMYLRRADSTVVLHPDEGVARGHLDTDLRRPSDDRRDPLFYLITMSLIILLRYRGWFPLHAAAVAQNGRGVLLTARSDSGKSTTALNLVRQGWSYLSDDTVLLRAEDDSVRAYSFRPDFCVDPEAADLFPELADHDWPSSLSDATKWRVDGQAAYPGQFTPTCVPRVLVVPSIADRPDSTLTPAERTDVLGHLFRQGALSMTPDRAVAQRHLELLKRLVHQTDTYRLDAGRDALDTPEVLDQLLASTLD